MGSDPPGPGRLIHARIPGEREWRLLGYVDGWQKVSFYDSHGNLASESTFWDLTFLHETITEIGDLIEKSWVSYLDGEILLVPLYAELARRSA